MSSKEAHVATNYKKVYEDFDSRNSPPRPEEAVFRLLKLHAGSFDHVLECELIPADLQSTSYEALSYSWGSPLPSDDKGASDSDGEWENVSRSEEDDASTVSDQREAAEEGAEENELLPHVLVNKLSVAVQPNLFSALQHLKNPNQERVIWIDYLCINQCSEKDRTAQVKRMDQVYSNAERVIIWLGEADGDTQSAFKEIVALNTDAHLSEIYENENPSAPPQFAARLAPLSRLLKRTWFDRMWVVQEAHLAREATIYVGEHQIPWQKLLTAATMFQKHLKCCAEIIGAVTNIFSEDIDTDELRYKFSEIAVQNDLARRAPNLHYVLQVFRDRLATDHRDRIYALLGILDPKERIVEPDYEMETAELYKTTTVKIIQKEQNLSALMDTNEYASGEIDLPWWCVDWTSLGVFGVQFWPLFKAAGSYKADGLERCTADTINLGGIVIDHTAHVIRDEDDGTDSRIMLLVMHKTLARWEAAARLAETGDQPYAAGGTRADAFWKTVLLGIKPGDTCALTNDDHRNYKQWRSWLDKFASVSSDKRSMLLPEVAENETIQAYNRLFNDYPAVRCFFETEDGYFGLGPITLQERDDVVVLAGGNLPFALRSVISDCEVCDADQSRSQFVGWCYIHGFMYGEALQPIESGEFRWRKFCIM